MEESDEQTTATKVNLTPRAKELVENIRKETGIPKQVAVERFFEWLASSDPKFRLAILNRDRDVQAELARLVLREMAGLGNAVPDNIGPLVPFDVAASVIHKMVERMTDLQQQSDHALGNALKKRK